MDYDIGTVLDNEAMAEVLLFFSITANASILSQSIPIRAWHCMLPTHTPHIPTRTVKLIRSRSFPPPV